MAVPRTLAVYSVHVIAASQIQAVETFTVSLILELNSCAINLEAGRSRLDIVRSKPLNLIRQK